MHTLTHKQANTHAHARARCPAQPAGRGGGGGVPRCEQPPRLHAEYAFQDDPRRQDRPDRQGAHGRHALRAGAHTPAMHHRFTRAFDAPLRTRERAVCTQYRTIGCPPTLWSPLNASCSRLACKSIRLSPNAGCTALPDKCADRKRTCKVGNI
eukprot:6196652-Pleurochrysis_carterae.AAC.2